MQGFFFFFFFFGFFGGGELVHGGLILREKNHDSLLFSHSEQK